MLKSKAAWQILEERAPRGDWLRLDQIYAIVETGVELEEADRAGISEKSASPKWKRTVRNVLQRKKSFGKIEWDGSGKFRFKSI